MITDFTSVTSEITSFSLDMLSMQHKYIANNIANANSKNYHPSKIDFSSIFESVENQLNNTSDVALVLDGVKADIQKGSHVITSNVIGVELDNELVNLSKNTIMYKALLSAMSSSSYMSIVLKAGR